MAETITLDCIGKDIFHSPEWLVFCRRFNIPYESLPVMFKLEWQGSSEVTVTQELAIRADIPPQQPTRTPVIGGQIKHKTQWSELPIPPRKGKQAENEGS